MLKVEETKIPVPVISNDVPDEIEDNHVGGPYWRRVRELVGEEGEQRGELKGSYWTRDEDELMSDSGSAQKEAEEDDDDDDGSFRGSGEGSDGSESTVDQDEESGDEGDEDDEDGDNGA